MGKYSAIFTTYGTQVLAKAIANNQPLRVTHFAVGDGNGADVTVSESQERLVNEKHRAAISAVSLDPRNNKQVIFELTIPENVGGFYIREMGVFDANNKLVAYANCPESFKPTLASGSGKVQVMRMILLVASSNAVTLTIDDSVIFVTRGQLNPKTITAESTNGFDNTGHSHEIDKASTTKTGIVRLTNDTGLDSETLGLTAKAGKALSQAIAKVRLALNNYIPLNKRSSAVNSNSAENVATSAAVKTAYDRAVDADNNAKGRVSKAGDTMTGALTVPHIIVNDPTNNDNSVQVGDDAKFLDIDNGHSIGLQSLSDNTKGYIAYGSSKKKFGFDGYRFLAESSIFTAQYGHGSYAEQYTSNAPYMVEESGTINKDAYHPFIKGRVRQKGQYGTAFSFGYTTKQGSGDGFGRGIIHMVEDNGSNRYWAFEHNGDFISGNDVKTPSGKSINNSVQVSEMVGEVAFFARSTPPSGWLKANGAAVSRTTYAALFAAIGTTFGTGDGSTTFNLPDLRGEFIRGVDDGRNVDIGRGLGSSQGDAIRNITGKFWSEFGGYKYVITTNADGVFALTENDGRRDTFKGDVANYGATNKKVEFSASRVVPTANENRPRNVALLACIKY